MAELLAEEGREFSDRKSLRDAAGQYEFVAHSYPGGSRAQDALIHAADLLGPDGINDLAGARAVREELASEYPQDASRVLEEEPAVAKPVPEQVIAVRLKLKQPGKPSQPQADEPSPLATEPAPLVAPSGAGAAEERAGKTATLVSGDVGAAGNLSGNLSGSAARARHSAAEPAPVRSVSRPSCWDLRRPGLLRKSSAKAEPWRSAGPVRARLSR